MKVRLSFVSNSSSCSFTCPVCDNRWDGYDWDDDPVCGKCGVHIELVKETFIDYLARKYKLNIPYERMLFRASQEGDPDY